MNNDLSYEDNSYYLNPVKSYKIKDNSDLKISKDSVLNEFPFITINRGHLDDENENEETVSDSRFNHRITNYNNRDLDSRQSRNNLESPSNFQNKWNQIDNSDSIRLPTIDNVRKPIRFDKIKNSKNQIMRIKKEQENDYKEENPNGTVIHHHHYYINSEAKNALPTLSPQFTQSNRVLSNHSNYSPRGSPLDYYTPKASPKYYSPMASPVVYVAAPSTAFGDQYPTYDYDRYNFDNRYDFNTQMLPPLKMNQKYPVSYNQFSASKGAYLGQNFNKSLKRTTSLNHHGLRRNFEGNYY